MTETTEGAAEAVTAESLQAEIDGVKAEPQPQETTETVEDDAPETEDKGEADQPKPKKTAKERIDELTWRLRETERREAQLLDRLTKTPAQAPQAESVAQTDSDPEPEPDEYVHGEADAQYVRDLARWEARQEFKALQSQSAKQTAAERISTTHAERETAFRAKAPDYDAVVSGEWTCTAEMAEALKTSEEGPAVAYHLASHPDEARRIAGLSPIAQARELGKLEAKLATPPVQQAKTVTDAPEPAPILRGKGGQFEISPDTNDFPAFEKLADRRLTA